MKRKPKLEGKRVSVYYNKYGRPYCWINRKIVYFTDWANAKSPWTCFE